MKLTTALNTIPESVSLLSPLDDDVLQGRGVFAGIEQERVLVRKDLSQAIEVARKLAAAVHLASAAGDSELGHSRCPAGWQFNSIWA